MPHSNLITLQMKSATKMMMASNRQLSWLKLLVFLVTSIGQPIHSPREYATV
ncbi:hypothetical protein RchiOBHm_Chr5g0073881 [Rosa chinensis]|uniref:Uncharacterized protein n=1 Tax=Rosa chinensis TaxID=74649 RepID=A0A2P6QL12_ROSCH|nr:hypothetical protein RchiOBHm_Chr5g0073881 [Rosa chinensis]